MEIDEETDGDYAVGEESGVLRGGWSHLRPGQRPDVHIDEDLFRSWTWFLDVHSLESNGSRCSWDLMG